MRFECKGYGDCCRNLKQKNLGRAKFSSGVLNLAMEPDQIALPLFDWEIESVKKLAEGYVSIKPLWIFLSHKNEPVVVMWSLNHDECPFLVENRCSVYGDRPSICRSFPVTSSGVIALMNGEKNIDIRSSNLCRCWKESMPKTQATVKEMFKIAYDMFGESYLGALNYDMQFMFAGRLLQRLADEKKVTAAYIDVKKAEKILSRGSIGFVDFLEREGIATRKDITGELENTAKNAKNLVGLS